MKEAIKWARGTGVDKLELTVFPHNEPAIALYRKLGFREEGLIARRYFIGGRYIDAMLMGLDLDKVEP
jgi:RimJ/RimL family protein N-acetyltransferase